MIIRSLNFIEFRFLYFLAKYCNYTLIYHPQAAQEYLDSVSWYEKSKKGLGARFIKEIEHMLDQIEATPFLFHVKKLQFREAALVSFPYTVVYKANKKKREIRILSIFHTYRNPTFKYKRK